MRPAEVAARGGRYLERHGVASARRNAELLLAGVLGIEPSRLALLDTPLTPAQARAYGRALCRRCTGTPLQHLTGEEGFRRLVVRVRSGVFVPRPETEVLVEATIDLLDASAGRAPVVVDVGTGTGAVALAIADERPGARVLAVDLSPEAVALARENALRLGLPVEVLEGDLLAPLPEDLRGRVDLVVSNPPYVPAEEALTLPPEVRADPPLALFGGPELADRLFAQAAVWLRPGGAVAVEIDARTAGAVRAAALARGLTEVAVRADLVGRDRVVTARRPA